MGRRAIRNPGGGEAAPERVRLRHSDFADPKGPLLAPDFHIPQGYQGETLPG